MIAAPPEANFGPPSEAACSGVATEDAEPDITESAQHDAELQNAFRERFLAPRLGLVATVYRRAVDRVRSEQAASTRESRYGAANVEPPADHVADVILKSEIGPALAHELSKYPNAVLDLNQSPPSFFAVAPKAGLSLPIWSVLAVSVLAAVRDMG